MILLTFVKCNSRGSVVVKFSCRAWCAAPAAGARPHGRAVRARQILLALVHASVAGTSFYADALPSNAIPTRIVGAAPSEATRRAVVAWLDGGGQVDATFKDTRQNVAVSGLTLLMAATDGGHDSSSSSTRCCGVELILTSRKARGGQS